MWHHQSCDHWIPKVWFPIGSRYEPTTHLSRLLRYWASKMSGSRPWPFGVTWRHLSRDHWIRNMGFPIGGQFEPTMYLTRLLRYWASNFWGNVTSSFTWPLYSWYAVSNRWSFETIALTRIVVEILLCQTLSQAYSHWKCTDPHFSVLGAKLEVIAFCNFVLVAAP